MLVLGACPSGISPGPVAEVSPSFTFYRHRRIFARMKCLVRLILFATFAAAPLSQARAAFSSLYVFGDTLSSTTNNADPGYHGQRYSNGRVWVEVLAERQGLVYDANKEWSHFNHDSLTPVTNVNTFTAPGDAATALFIVWVNNADFVFGVNNYLPLDDGNIGTWTNVINSSLSNHLAVVQALHAKGARTIIMPNAVDLMQIPLYAAASATNRAFVRARVIQFNNGFTNVLAQAMSSLSNLTIHSPNMFKLLDDVMTQPAAFGLTNALLAGTPIAALDDPALVDKSLNGPGTNHIYWDFLDPSAKFHARIADTIQQSIWPVRISKITALSASNRLDLVNAPIGLNGFADGSTNFIAWTSAQSITTTSAVQSVLVPVSGPRQFYRLRFPFAWSWP